MYSSAHFWSFLRSRKELDDTQLDDNSGSNYDVYRTRRQVGKEAAASMGTHFGEVERCRISERWNSSESGKLSIHFISYPPSGDVEAGKPLPMVPL